VPGANLLAILKFNTCITYFAHSRATSLAGCSSGRSDSNWADSLYCFMYSFYSSLTLLWLSPLRLGLLVICWRFLGSLLLLSGRTCCSRTNDILSLILSCSCCCSSHITRLIACLNSLDISPQTTSWSRWLLLLLHARPSMCGTLLPSESHLATPILLA
jgi:hypothetical protein